MDISYDMARYLNTSNVMEPQASNYIIGIVT